MLTRDDLTCPGVAYRSEALEAERERLTRRIGWALRRKDADRAEHLEERLASLEARLAPPPPRRPVWTPAALLGA